MGSTYYTEFQKLILLWDKYWLVIKAMLNNKRKTECITLNTITKLEHLDKTSEPKPICLAEVAYPGIFACKENFALPGTRTSSISVKKKRKTALYSYKEFH